MDVNVGKQKTDSNFFSVLQLHLQYTVEDEDSMLILGLDSKVFNPNLSDNSKHKTPSFYYIQGIPKLVK